MPRTHPFSRSILTALALGVCCLIVLPAAARPSAKSAGGSAAGIWYGKGEPDDPMIVYIDDLKADGTFHSEFRKYQGCTVVWRQVETGTWNVDGNVLTTAGKTVNGIAEPFVQTYTVEGVDAHVLRIRHDATGFLFVEQRVPRFEFPQCWTGS